MELNKKKNFKKGPKAKPAPVYDNFQKEIANDLLEQAKHFLLNIVTWRISCSSWVPIL